MRCRLADRLLRAWGVRHGARSKPRSRRTYACCSARLAAYCVATTASACARSVSAASGRLGVQTFEWTADRRSETGYCYALLTVFVCSGNRSGFASSSSGGRPVDPAGTQRRDRDLAAECLKALACAVSSRSCVTSAARGERLLHAGRRVGSCGPQRDSRERQAAVARALGAREPASRRCISAADSDRLRWPLYALGSLPLHLPAFLEWCACVERRWLRIADAYEFRHRELLEHLTQPAMPADLGVDSASAVGRDV